MSINSYIELLEDMDWSIKNKPIDIPIAITANNKPINLELNEYGLSVVSGIPGTGKSTIIRMIIANILSLKPNNDVELFLADTTGYEFIDIKGMTPDNIKLELLNQNDKCGEELLDKIHSHFLEKMRLSDHNDSDDSLTGSKTKKTPLTIVVIDDAHFMINHLLSQSYILKFEKLIAQSWIYGFRFVLLCQNFDFIYRTFPTSIRQRISQEVYLSPYTKQNIINGRVPNRNDEDIEDNTEHFSVLVKKKNNDNYEKGKLLYISQNELKTVIEKI